MLNPWVPRQAVG